LRVKPVGLAAAVLPAVPAQQHVNAAIAVPDSYLRDLAHALSQRQLRILHAAVVVSAARVPEQGTGPTPADAVMARQVHHRFTLQRGPPHFFEATSCRIALSRLSSATSFFSRAFSSCNCLSSRAWSGCSPL